MRSMRLKIENAISRMKWFSLESWIDCKNIDSLISVEMCLKILVSFDDVLFCTEIFLTHMPVLRELYLPRFIGHVFG